MFYALTKTFAHSNISSETRARLGFAIRFMQFGALMGGIWSEPAKQGILIVFRGPQCFKHSDLHL